MRLQGGRTLVDGQFVEADLCIDDVSGLIDTIGADGGNGRAFDARGLYVLPGIVDIHGDAFERQLMPRPGVSFPIDVALVDSDRQAVASGITTVFHGVTWSWEPGLRGAGNARALVSDIATLRPALAADTHCHLRLETFNLDAEAEVIDWLSDRRIGMLGFNDHMPGEDTPPNTRQIAQMAERAGLSQEDFLAMVARLRARGNEVPGSIARLAAVANANSIATLSHDDMSPEQRRWFRDLDCRLAEFPITRETAEDAIASGDDVVMGAPNVVRGGSHVGWIGAADMIARGNCTILASDYYYPALLLAAFRLAADNVAPLDAAWAYISANPARAAGLHDRGTLSTGKRADIILVDASDAMRPKTIATISNGRIVHLADAARLH